MSKLSKTAIAAMLVIVALFCLEHTKIVIRRTPPVVHMSGIEFELCWCDPAARGLDRINPFVIFKYEKEFATNSRTPGIVSLTRDVRVMNKVLWRVREEMRETEEL